MTAWYRGNAELFEKERLALAEASPLMGLSIMGPGFALNSYCTLKVEAAVAHGTHQVAVPNNGEKLEYKIALLTPANFPNRPPIMLCDDSKLPWKENLDRHIHGLGQACLAVNAEVRLYWPPNSSLAVFLKRLVDPWLLWQAYYDIHGEGPPSGERKHGLEGILEFYRELWGTPLPEKFDLKAFLLLLALKEMPKGHHPCPCGSGKKLRDCHLPLVVKKWSALDQPEVKKDLEVIRTSSR